MVPVRTSRKLEPLPDFKPLEVKKMPCSQPLVRIEYLNQYTKTKTGKLTHKAHVYSINSDTYRYILEEIKDGHTYKETLIPCGQCIECRLNYSRQWANRGYLEAQLHDENYFITLTYDDEHLHIPEQIELFNTIYKKEESWKGDLCKRDLQLFFKRLRKRIGKFSYLACGEYGSKHGRPHYHAILFGAKLDPETFYNPRLINHEWYWQNDIIEECWTEETGSGGNHAPGKSMGFSNISLANWNTIAYTARYVVKKINGEGSEELYAALGRTQKEFITTSKKPAIGKEWYNLHHEEIKEKDKIMIHNKNGTYEVTTPKYFDRLREKYEESEVKKVKNKRKKEAIKKAEIKDTTTTLSRMEQLQVEAREKEKKNQMLIRQLDPEKRKDGKKEKRPRPRREETWLKGITLIPPEEK